MASTDLPTSRYISRNSATNPQADAPWAPSYFVACHPNNHDVDYHTRVPARSIQVDDNVVAMQKFRGVDGGVPSPNRILMSRYCEGEWVPRNARGRLPIVDFISWVTVTFCHHAAPGLLLTFPAPFSPHTCTKLPSLTGATTPSREPTTARLCQFSVRPLWRSYFWIPSEQTFCTRK